MEAVPSCRRSPGFGGQPQGLVSVATVMCGQLMSLKFSSTICEYCSRLNSVSPATFCSQNVAATCAPSAFGQSLVPTREAMFDAPPPTKSPGGDDPCGRAAAGTC